MSGAALDAEPDRHPGPDPEPAQVPRQPVRPARSARDRSAARPRSRPRRRRASGAAWASKSWWTRERAGPRPSVAFQRARSPVAPASVRIGRSATRPVGVGDDRFEQGSEVAEHPVDRSRRRTGRCCTRASRRGPSSVSAIARVRSNFAVPRPRRGRAGRASGRPGRRRACWLFWRTNITWKSGVRLGSRVGSSASTRSSKRQVLVLERPQRRLADPAEQVAEASGRPRGRRGATSMLTK